MKVVEISDEVEELQKFDFDLKVIQKYSDYITFFCNRWLALLITKIAFEFSN